MRGRLRLITTAIILAIGVALIVVGASALVTSNNEPKLVVNTTPSPISTLLATITPPSTPAPPATPTPSTASIARIIIEKLKIDAKVVVKGLDKDGVMEVPDTPYDVAWYDFSAHPGHGKNAVFSGHVDWYPNITGVFWGLRNLAEGDIVKVRLEDGTEYTYKVTENWMVDADNAPVMEIVGPTAKEVVTLITCGGQFTRDPQTGLGSYLSRRIVRAERIT